MADKKISALDAIVAIDDADVLPIVDASVSTTKKINVSQVKALAPVQSVAGKTGSVALAKGDVGLSNVDNTADADKPVSSATQTALNAKQDTLVSGTNIKTINDESILGSGNITISGGGGISDGDKGDITVSASGATWTIDNGVVTDAKVASGIDAAKIADGTVSNAEYQYLGGVTSDIQTQLNAKQDDITLTTIGSSGAATFVDNVLNIPNYEGGGGSTAWGGITGTLSDQTDLQSALDGKVDENAAITGDTKTKITYDAKGLVTAGADATTADIADSADKRYVTDAQLTVIGNTSGTNTGDNATNSQYSGLDDAKTNKLITTNRQTASYTLVLSDADKLVEMNVATANDLTIPLNSSVAFATGTQILLAQYGAGQTTIVATSGVTVRSNGAKLKLNVQYSGATLIKIGTDEWYLFGDIVA